MRQLRRTLLLVLALPACIKASPPTVDAPTTADAPTTQPAPPQEPTPPQQPASSPAASTFRVEGRFLVDRCGERVVLRGINEMIVWTDGRDGVPEFAEIAKTGANTVRIVWDDEGSAIELKVAIQNALSNKMIPIVEHHAATGDLSKVPAAVDYWLQPDVLAVIKQFEADLLLNIANEPGKANETQQRFEAVYTRAIRRLRDAGLKLPLMIDAPHWGQDIDMLQAIGPRLVDFDPEKNILLSVHMWWDDDTGERVRQELKESVELGLPLVVGEFAQHAVLNCDENPFAYKVLLAEAQKHEIGWLAWSWGSKNNDDCAGRGSFDITIGGQFGRWEETWGGDIAVRDPNSIQKTSVRPHSIVEGRCSRTPVTPPRGD